MVRYLAAILSVVLFACLTSDIASAGDDPYDALNSITELTTRTISGSECSVEAVAEFEKYPPLLPVFRDAWLNKDYSVDFYNQHRKQIFLFVIVKRYAELMTESVYRQPDYDSADQCSFSIKIRANDKYGQSQLLPAITWNFDRQLANKINWDKFDPATFPDIALNYDVSEHMNDWISSEPKMTEAKGNDDSGQSSNCNLQYLRANAIFMRATTFCKKDYLDSPAGMYALAMSRQCSSLTEDEMTAFASKFMKEMDATVKSHGRAAACRWVDKLEADVMHSATN